MNKNKVILVAGGDLRQVYLAEILSRTNKVYAIGFDRNIISSEKIIVIESLMSLSERVDYIILPLPASNDGVLVNSPFFKHSIPLDNLTSILKDDGLVFGGKISAMTKEVFEKRGIESIDYLNREEMSVLNAVPTALSKLHI